MRQLAIAALAILIPMATPTLCLASELPSSVFSTAVVKGEASAEIPDDGEFSSAVRIVKSKTGDPGPVVIFAKRLVKFEQQPQCARVGFAIGQPTSKVFYSDMGGQLNICADGEPPLRMCKSQPTKLVPANASCPDGSMPVDTPEVAAAIAAALRRLTHVPRTRRTRRAAW
ncbi:hypothetical protein ACU80P_22085 [Pandoraea sputorum]